MEMVTDNDNDSVGDLVLFVEDRGSVSCTCTALPNSSEQSHYKVIILS